MYSKFLPTIIHDQFFPNPDEIVNFANTLVYKGADTKQWPGTRSVNLAEVYPDFFSLIINKYLLLHFDKVPNIIGCANFQRVPPEIGAGWVHNDIPELHTIIIFLTKNAFMSTGTSLWLPKDKVTPPAAIHLEKKHAFFGGDTSVDVEKIRNENNDRFVETLRINNIYNRVIGFDSHLYHSANSYDSGDGERLTLVMFISDYEGKITPIQRSEIHG